MIRVAVDGYVLAKPLAGIGRYVLEMCRSLSTHKNYELCMYCPYPIDLKQHQLTNIRLKTSNCNNNLMSHIWTETILPYWVSKDQCDILWAPNHNIPSLLPKHIARVVTIHDLVWKIVPQTMPLTRRCLERLRMPKAIKQADHIITCTSATAHKLTEHFSCDINKISVIPLGYQHTTHTPCANLSHDADNTTPYCLFIGTLEPRKNLVRLLQAYAQLPPAVKQQHHLIIVGNKGWGGLKLDSLIKQLKLQKQVKILGYVDDSTLSSLINDCEFLAMPSLYEGFGLPLLEAMSYGKPVLTANNSSMPEVAQKAGYYVNATDISDISNGLHQLFTNASLRNTLASHARSTASQFSWQKSALLLTDVFTTAINLRRTKAS